MLHELECVQCGKSFFNSDKHTKYCSRQCRYEAQKKYHICQHCGKPFYKLNGYRIKYCSPECQWAAFAEAHPKKPKKPKKVYTRACRYCGKMFTTTNKTKNYCSNECTYNQHLFDLRQQWKEQFVPQKKICKECGSEFMTECGDTHSVFCCTSCAKRFEKRKERSTLRHKKTVGRLHKIRNEQIAKTDCGDVSYAALYTRDKGVCQICGLPVHPDKGIDSDWGGSIDHIIPLSLGGKHSMSNCQLAHRICNSIKCQEGTGYSIDWEVKAKQDNYWRIKFEKEIEIIKKLSHQNAELERGWGASISTNGSRTSVAG